MEAPMATFQVKKRWVTLGLTMCAALPMNTGAAVLRGNLRGRLATLPLTSLYNSLSDCADCSSTEDETTYGAAVSRGNVNLRVAPSAVLASLYNSLSYCPDCTIREASGYEQKTAPAAPVLRGNTNRRFAGSMIVTSLYNSLGDCADCASYEASGVGQKTASGAAESRGSTVTSLYGSLSDCTDCSSSFSEASPDALEATPGVASSRGAASRGLATSTATSRYSSLSDCTGCTSSEASNDERETASAVSTATATISTSSMIISASASSSATATFTLPGSDDGGDGDDDGGDDDEEEKEDDGDDDDDADDDDEQTDDDEEQTASLIKVLTPIDGDVICPESGLEVTFNWTGVEGEDTAFHVDLHDCGQDACCGDCGEFVLALCAEEGCDCSDAKAVHVAADIPQGFEGTGPYYKIVVSTDDGSRERGCSGTFTISGDVDPSSDDYTNNDDSTSSYEEDDETSVEEVTSNESDDTAGRIVLESCESFDPIPYPLPGDMEVYVGLGVTELQCSTPKTVHVSGGTLKIVVVGGETVVFNGIRFELENAATVLFTGDAATEFTGVADMRLHGGIFNVAEDARVDIPIYNEGSVYLRGGAVFSENLVSIDSDGYEAGDGGAVWNGPTGRLVVESTAVLRSNGVEAGGRGGALWNEGFVEFKGTAEFALNVATISGDSENDAGIGGGIFNHEGLVRFRENATFIGNYAQGGAAFVNSGEGNVVFHAEATVVGNISNEEEGSLAGAVWNQEDGVVISKDSVSFVGNRGHNAAAMLNEGIAVFRAGVSVRENSAVMDGGGFINGSGARMVFYDGAEFLANTGAGSGGAILNRAKLVFKVDEGDFSTLTFKDNLCCRCLDIHGLMNPSVRTSRTSPGAKCPALKGLPTSAR
ncbi:unnamed protein product [Ascophyllum nodosum]